MTVYILQATDGQFVSQLKSPKRYTPLPTCAHVFWTRSKALHEAHRDEAVLSREKIVLNEKILDALVGLLIVGLFVGFILIQFYDIPLPHAL